MIMKSPKPNRRIVVIAQCSMCEQVHYIVVPKRDYTRWMRGKAVIQDAMPYMHPDVRELMLSGVCGECFDKMFDNGEEE